MGANAQASRLRRRMGEDLQVLARLAQAAQERSAMLAGSCYERRRRCGKRGCRCAQGRLHRGMALAVKSDGRRRLLSLGAVEMDKIVPLTGSYRRMRQARAEMVRVFGELLNAFDALGRLRQIGIGPLRQILPGA